MLNKSRETWLKIGVAALVGLYLLDHFILPSAMGSWKAQSTRLETLQTKVVRGRRILQNERSIRSRWTQMQTTDLNEDSSTAENDVYKALNRWSQNSRTSFTSLTFSPWRNHDEGYETYECRATVLGDQASLGRLIYELETDPLPARVEDCEMTARDAQGKQINLALKFSFVRIGAAVKNAR